MKGRRKATTAKWARKFQIETEACRLMASRSASASNRFLDAVSHRDASSEPGGRLAGAQSHAPSQHVDLPALLLRVIDAVRQAGRLLIAEWARAGGLEDRAIRPTWTSTLNANYVGDCSISLIAITGMKRPATASPQTDGAGWLTPTMAPLISQRHQRFGCVSRAAPRALAGIECGVCAGHHRRPSGLHCLG